MTVACVVYVTKLEDADAVAYQAAIVFSASVERDRVLQGQLAACAGALVSEQESCTGLATILLKDIGASARPPVMLLQSADELTVRSFLLRWYRLSEALAGSCAVVADAETFEGSIARIAGVGFEIDNRAESQDDVSFYPAYRLLDRAPQLAKAMRAQGCGATLAWRIHPRAAEVYERELRINLVRLRRSWVPARIREEQEQLAGRFLASTSTAQQFVIVRHPAEAELVRTLLHADSAALAKHSGFSRSLLREHAGLSATRLPQPADDNPRLGDSVPPGFLFDVLAAQIGIPSESIAPAIPKRARRVFISYSHKDKEFAAQLSTSCAQLRRDGWIHLWSDAEILPGSDWSDEIHAALEQADLVVLLISPDFIQSDFCYGIEMRRALERHAAGQARVLPIIIRATDTAGAPFARLQMLPAEGKPVAIWADRDSAWLDVARGLRRLLETMARSER